MEVGGGALSAGVVIPTYNRADMLPTAVRAVLLDPLVAEVVVVDDGSTDATPEVVGALAGEDSRIQSVRTDNRGQLAALAAGIEAATTDVVVAVDDDVVAAPGLVSGHVSHHRRDSGVVVLGYMPAVAARPGPDAWTTRLYAKEYEGLCRRYEDDPGEVLRNLWFGNVSLRREDWARVGFDVPRRYDYHQDQEFGLRAARQGLRGVFDRDLLARHFHYRSAPGFVRDARKAGFASYYLHHEYEELLGPLSPGWATAGLPRPVAALVRASRRPTLHRLLAASLPVAVGAAGRVSAGRVQEVLGRLLRRVELQTGLDLAAAEAILVT